jgi:uncharacterized protein (TIGR03437 family)
VGFSDATYLATGYPLPRIWGGASVLIGGTPVPLLSVSPTQIVAQLPWETPVSASMDVEIDTDWSTPFLPVLTGKMQTVSGMANFLTNPTLTDSAEVSGYDALVIHQDWSAPVTPSNPARPNEILHLYGSGFGPVSSQPRTGLPAPANPLSPTVNPITCAASTVDHSSLNVPVLFSGLAPGAVGIYQLDIQLPQSIIVAQAGMEGVGCTGSGNDSEFGASFAFQPFPL